MNLWAWFTVDGSCIGFGNYAIVLVLYIRGVTYRFHGSQPYPFRLHTGLSWFKFRSS